MERTLQECKHRCKEEERKEIETCWEMASVLSFLEVFAEEVELPAAWTIDGLERAVLTDRGAETELVDLHISILRALHPKTAIDEHNWCALASKKVRSQPCMETEAYLRCFARCGSNECPIVHERFTPREKLKLLLFMCELRMQCEDIRSRIERAASTSKRKMSEEGQGMETLRPRPLGTDSTGAVYWFVDLGNEKRTHGFRMYKEIPHDSNKAGPRSPMKWWAKKKTRTNLGGSLTNAPVMNTLQKIAHEIEEIEEIADYLASGAARADRRLGKVINETIVSELYARKRKEEKRQAAAQRLHVALGDTSNLYGAETAGRGRRERKVVNYTFDNYDRQIEDSIRAQINRHRKLLPERMNIKEPHERGLRRGRSAGPNTSHPESSDHGILLSSPASTGTEEMQEVHEPVNGPTRCKETIESLNQIMDSKNACLEESHFGRDVTSLEREEISISVEKTVSDADTAADEGSEFTSGFTQDDSQDGSESEYTCSDSK